MIQCNRCNLQYMGETKRRLKDRFNEHRRTIDNPNNKSKPFIDRDPHWYTRRVKEAIHIRLHPNNINRDSGIEIPEAWIPTIKKHNNRKWYNSGPLREQLLAGTMEH